MAQLKIGLKVSAKKKLFKCKKAGGKESRHIDGNCVILLINLAISVI